MRFAAVMFDATCVRLYELSASRPTADLSALGLDTDTVKLTVKTLSGHLITGEFDSPTNSLRSPYVRVEL
eukprot:1176557-Prorocentrum_minimum.AAC.5